MSLIDAYDGHWQALQEAGSLGKAGDTVLIPRGEHDYVDVDEPWPSVGYVTLPNGVNIGAATPTPKDTNGYPTSWPTVLRVPWNCPNSGKRFFYWYGSKNLPVKVSDLMLIGQRYYDHADTARVGGFNIGYGGVSNFRFHHLFFQDITWGGIAINDGGGVIDHSFFVNSVGKVVSAIADSDVIYGVNLGDGKNWVYHPRDIMGKYFPEKSVYIEDCYFEKWRHCIAANSGTHYVLRNSTINADYFYGAVDGHGWWQSYCRNTQHPYVSPNKIAWSELQQKWVCGEPVAYNPEGICGQPIDPQPDGTPQPSSLCKLGQVGTNCMEIYDCKLINPAKLPNVSDAYTPYEAIYPRGGYGVAYNNVFGTLPLPPMSTVPHPTKRMYSAFYMVNDSGSKPWTQYIWTNHWYIWNNQYLDVANVVLKYDPENAINEGVNYHFRSPSMAMDGFVYTPYPYPHPLVTETPNRTLRVEANILGIPFNIRRR